MAPFSLSTVDHEPSAPFTIWFQQNFIFLKQQPVTSFPCQSGSEKNRSLSYTDNNAIDKQTNMDIKIVIEIYYF